MPAKAQPFNRLFHQLIRDRQLTLNQKCRDLVMQIFGHEALVKAEDTADIKHCVVFDVDFYRLHTIRKEHLAVRKLMNPFKWIEFIVVAPLELLSWGFQNKIDSKATLYWLEHIVAWENIKAAQVSKKERVKKTAYVAMAVLFILLLTLCSTVINLSINITTGIIRRFLAPVRYLIRPAIETAKKYPKSFATIVAITLGVALGLTVIVLTGGVPAIMGGLFVMGTLAVKLAMVGSMGVVLGAALTKGFNTVREWIEGLVVAIKKPNGDEREQMRCVGERNQQLNYNLKIMDIEDQKDWPKARLDQERKDDSPLLIRVKDGPRLIYGRSPEGGTCLKEIKPDSKMNGIYCLLEHDIQLLPFKPEDKQVEANKLYVYQEDKSILYAINTPSGIMRVEVAAEFKDHSALLAILGRPNPNEGEGSDNAKAAVLAILLKEGCLHPQFIEMKFNQVRELTAAKIHPDIYEEINDVRGHTPRKVGSTNKITEAFHAIDIDHVEVRGLEVQDRCYTAALFTGTESLFYPKKTLAPSLVLKNTGVDQPCQQKHSH